MNMSENAVAASINIFAAGVGLLWFINFSLTWELKQDTKPFLLYRKEAVCIFCEQDKIVKHFLLHKSVYSIVWR